MSTPITSLEDALALAESLDVWADLGRFGLTVGDIHQTHIGAENGEPVLVTLSAYDPPWITPSTWAEIETIITNLAE